MQRVRITKKGDPNEGKTGIADVYDNSIIVFFGAQLKPIFYGPLEVKSLGKVSVKEAVFFAYQRLHEYFHILDLVRAVRDVTGRQALTDATISRRLRELSGDDKHPKKLSYKYNSKTYKYHKL